MTRPCKLEKYTNPGIDGSPYLAKFAQEFNILSATSSSAGVILKKLFTNLEKQGQVEILKKSNYMQTPFSPYIPVKTRKLCNKDDFSTQVKILNSPMSIGNSNCAV